MTEAHSYRRSDIPDEAVCRAAARGQDQWERGENRVSLPDALAAEFAGCPEKVIWAAMERAECHGLIECGTSLRFAWLTDKGRALVAGPTGAIEVQAKVLICQVRHEAEARKLLASE